MFTRSFIVVLLLLLSMLPSQAFGQQTQNSQNSWDKVEQMLLDLQIQIQSLKANSTELSKQIELLKADLAKSEASLTASQATVAQQKTLLSDLSLRLENSEKLLADKQKQYDDLLKQAKDVANSLNVWKWVAIGEAVVVIGIGTYALLKK